MTAEVKEQEKWEDSRGRGALGRGVVVGPVMAGGDPPPDDVSLEPLVVSPSLVRSLPGSISTSTQCNKEILIFKSARIRIIHRNHTVSMWVQYSKAEIKPRWAKSLIRKYGNDGDRPNKIEDRYMQALEWLQVDLSNVLQVGKGRVCKAVKKGNRLGIIFLSVLNYYKIREVYSSAWIRNIIKGNPIPGNTIIPGFGNKNVARINNGREK